MTFGHIHCKYGRTLVSAHPNPVFEEQKKRDVKQKFDLLTTAAFLLAKGPNRGRK